MPKKKNSSMLGELETAVMKAVWKQGKATVRQVLEELNSRRKLAYTTILTTMRNLERKGFLSHEIQGRSHVYLPRMDEETVARNAVVRLVQSFFDGSPLRLANALFKEEDLSKEEFEKLRKQILELRSKEVDHGTDR